MRTLDLSGQWRLIREATGKAYGARVPGDTHSALLAAGAIPDPYVGTNELDVQWVGREDWSWERAFEVDSRLLAEERIDLVCERLDTVAEVFVNGARVGAADNMFARWRFDVKRHLRRGRNTLRILFHSAENAARALAGRLPYPVPCSQYPIQSPHRNLVRKTQCHAGWDWGPCLMVCGIYGAIGLEAFSDARIDYVLTEQRFHRAPGRVGRARAGRCVVRVAVQYEAARTGECELAVELGTQRAKRTVRLARGAGETSVDIAVEHPRLWWPNGYGEQPLYALSVRLGSHEIRKRIGLRTLDVVSRPDRAGLSLVFRVNGIDIFCKGANWIPFDALPQRQTRHRLDGLLSSAAEAGMNMLRVWGGGQYESDSFYELCDEKGLLVWQDMMFSCSLYPATRAFLASVEREVRHQVKRLRDHPCLALWCGNNENVGALTWFPESRKNRDRYLVDYDRLNEGVIGRVIDECDPGRVFWPSSPCAGRDDYSDNWHSDTRGDMHYWSVWHESRPFSAYYEVSPRFCSEFGFQSFPTLGTIRTYAGPEEWNATAPVMEHHQRNPRGNSIITEMMTRYFRVPEGFESFVYLSQVQQAVAIATAVEYWRRLRPHCMGTLYWQLNDTWPVCSWSSLEYDGTWKLLHYAARRFYAPVLLAGQARDGRLEVWLTSDRTDAVDCRAVVRVMGFRGDVRRTKTFSVRLPAGSARRLWAVDFGQLSRKPEDAFVSLLLEHEGKRAHNEVFLAEPKRCGLARARVRTSVTSSARGFAVRVSSDAPAFYAALSTEGIPGTFSDNFFCVLPGEPRTVTFTPRRKVSLDQVRRALALRHLRDTYR